MLQLALTIALGIVLAVIILAALPTIAEVLAKVLGLLAALAIAWLLLLALSTIFDMGYTALDEAGPWLLLLISLTAWGLSARKAAEQLVRIVRQAPGTAPSGWILASLVVSALTLYPLYLMEERADPIMRSADLPVVLRVVVVLPVLISLGLLVTSALVEGVKRAAGLLAR